MKGIVAFASPINPFSLPERKRRGAVRLIYINSTPLMMRYHLFSQQENHQKDLILSCFLTTPHYSLQPLHGWTELFPIYQLFPGPHYEGQSRAIMVIFVNLHTCLSIAQAQRNRKGLCREEGTRHRRHIFPRVAMSRGHFKW